MAIWKPCANKEFLSNEHVLLSSSLGLTIITAAYNGILRVSSNCHKSLSLSCSQESRYKTPGPPPSQVAQVCATQTMCAVLPNSSTSSRWSSLSVALKQAGKQASPHPLLRFLPQQSCLNFLPDFSQKQTVALLMAPGCWLCQNEAEDLLPRHQLSEPHWRGQQTQSSYFLWKAMATGVAANALDEERKGCVVPMSGGNHKQGLSHETRCLDPQQICLLFSKGHSCYRSRRTGERCARLFTNALWMPTGYSQLGYCKKKR